MFRAGFVTIQIMIESLSYANIVSSLALLTAVVALVWNIIRDLIADKIQIEFYIAGNITNSSTRLFADAGSLKPDHYFDNPVMFVHIINTGSKQIGINGLGGKYLDQDELSVVLEGLPRMLQPYEVFSTVAPVKNHFLENVQNKQIKSLWITDTKNNKWYLSKRGWKRLQETAAYIHSGKHIPGRNET